MKTFDSDANFQQFRKRAKGGIKTIQSSSSGTSSSGAVQTYSRTVDTRNTEKKLMDIFTDEWRRNNSGYLTASYMAQGAAARRALGNARYLREKAGGTRGKTGKTGKTDIQYADDSIMAQEKLVSDLTQKWKTASGELRDGYLKDLEEAQQKLAEMTGKAKGDGAPTFTMAQLEGMSFDNQIPTTRGNEGKAQDKLDLATAAFATSGTSNVDFSNYTAALQNAIKDANIGSELYAQLSEQLSDSSQVSQLLQQYVANGITGADLGQTAQELKAKLMNGEINDDVIQQYVDELNAKLMEKFDETEWPNVLITFDADTKNIVNAAQQQEKEAQKMAKNWQAAGSANTSRRCRHESDRRPSGKGTRHHCASCGNDGTQLLAGCCQPRRHRYRLGLDSFCRNGSRYHAVFRCCHQASHQRLRQWWCHSWQLYER